MRPDAAPGVTAELIAEAAAWLAILHGPNRTRITERGFAQWIKRSEAHALAFEESTGIWEESRGLKRPRRQAPPVYGERIRTRRFVLPVAAALAAVAVAALQYLEPTGIQTGVGEQRVMTLDDGSRVILNTDTRLVVAYDDKVRRIELKAGEALFEVAQESKRPFIVAAGDRTIQALGTSFAVRRDAQNLSVTLVEGKVAIKPLDAAAVTYLTPGERVVFNQSQPAQKDRPQLEKLLAWQRREVAFDNSSLQDAIAEMNRYNRKSVEVDAPGADQMNVTGLFRAGDSLSFARAVAEAYQLAVIDGPERILLRK